tara:strand:+ start:18857 stop:19015 length:159 start_codon:yes stop_codon:yes gene_type:complete
MIGEYLFNSDFPKHVKSVYCNGRTYTREEFLEEKEKYLLRKKKNKEKLNSSI